MNSSKFLTDDRAPHLELSPAARLLAACRQRPMAAIMFVAVVLRFLAVVFSKGYGMHDDHFFVVEIAQRWLEGHRDWLDDPESFHGLFYPGAHALLFALLQKLGMVDPQAKMAVVRSLHALYSLLTVIFGYKIALLLTNSRRALLAGMLLAVFWIIPFMSVRNLIEVVCQPPLVIGFYLLLKNPMQGNFRRVFVAGLLFGAAFAIRFQSAILPVTAGLALLILRRWRAVVALGIGFALSCSVIQGGTDWIGYGRPFVSVLAYLKYNSDPNNIYGYVIAPWHRYLGLMAGILIPPMSVLLLYGYLRTWRRAALLFWPVLAFFVFHSAYPNKQERFLLPVLPLLLILAVIGWEEFAATSRFWTRRPHVLRWFWRWFWTVNTLLLLVYSTTYSKKTRVETLYYLRGRPDLRGVVLESSERSIPMPPLFYLDRPVPVYELPSVKGVDALGAEIAASGRPKPNYVVFMGEGDMAKRVERVSRLFPNLVFDTRITPSLVDHTAHTVNPRHNVNLSCDIYRNESAPAGDATE